MTGMGVAVRNGGTDDGAAVPPLFDWRRSAEDQRIDSLPEHLREQLAATAQRIAATFELGAEVRERMAAGSQHARDYHRRGRPGIGRWRSSSAARPKRFERDACWSPPGVRCSPRTRRPPGRPDEVPMDEDDGPEPRPPKDLNLGLLLLLGGLFFLLVLLAGIVGLTP